VSTNVEILWVGTNILYMQTIILLACSLLNIIQLHDWSSH